MSTLTIPPNLTSPRDDAMQLHRAFKGLGCDTSAMINILAHRDGTQRAYIQHEYRNLYHEDIFKRLKSELTGDLERAVLLWMLDPAGRDAKIVREALTTKSDVRVATEVICSRSSSQIQVFKKHYFSMFGFYLEQDIEQHASGDLKKLLLAYVSIPRYEGPEVDRMLAEKHAETLYKAGEKRLGTDEKKFIQIFSEASRAHLAAIDQAYHNMYGHSLKKAVRKETSGHFEHGLLTILRCSKNPAKFFAKVLHKSMKGLGTNESTLTRVIVTRAEIDMQYIKQEYYKKYKKPLYDAVHSETSGNYRAFLLELLGPSY